MSSENSELNPITIPLEKITALLTNELAASGATATYNHANVNPPCAFVAPLRVDEWTPCGPIIVAEVMLVASDHGTMHALERLENMLRIVLPALNAAGYEVTDVTLADSVTILPAGHDLPCFTIKTKIY